jgi:hypothetical protein
MEVCNATIVLSWVRQELVCRWRCGALVAVIQWGFHACGIAWTGNTSSRIRLDDFVVGRQSDAKPGFDANYQYVSCAFMLYRSRDVKTYAMLNTATRKTQESIPQRR